MYVLESHYCGAFTDITKGGGYGGGNGRQDLSHIINSNNNSFVGVAIQYRVRK
jgi:hypothetical protein